MDYYFAAFPGVCAPTQLGSRAVARGGVDPDDIVGARCSRAASAAAERSTGPLRTAAGHALSRFTGVLRRHIVLGGRDLTTIHDHYGPGCVSGAVRWRASRPTFSSFRCAPSANTFGSVAFTFAARPSGEPGMYARYRGTGLHPLALSSRQAVGELGGADTSRRVSRRAVRILTRRHRVRCAGTSPRVNAPSRWSTCFARPNIPTSKTW